MTWEPPKTSHTYQATVAEIVQHVRQMTYPNTATERATVQRIDEWARKQISGFEELLVSQLREHMTHVQSLGDAVTEHIELLDAFADAADADEEFGLGDWQHWDDSAAVLIDKALAAPEAAQRAIARAHDPMRELVQIQEKFPALNRPQP